MRFGTFACWAWGHKFIGTFDSGTCLDDWRTSYKVLNFCIRCGVSRPNGVDPVTAPASEPQTLAEANEK